MNLHFNESGIQGRLVIMVINPYKFNVELRNCLGWA